MSVPVKDNCIEIKRLSPADGHQYFYGYYDNPAWSGDDRYHLCHRVSFWDRLPEADDIAEIGMIDMGTGEFIKLTETSAWNFQQGSMLQWHPLAPNDEIIYNVYTEKGYKGMVMNIHTKQLRYLEQPVANVDPTGHYGLSVNFSRMFDFRPGYGYAGIADPFLDDHSENDGVYLVDLQTGSSKLVLSLNQLWQFTKKRFSGEERKLLINHITFNTNGTRFICLVRHFPVAGKSGWQTALVTASRDGSDLFLLSDYSYASHYNWRDPEHIVFHSRGSEGSDMGNQLYVLRDLTHEVTAIDPSFFLVDGHCSYSPDRTKMLYDSYPDSEGYRHLYLYDLAASRGVKLGSFYSDPRAAVDIRCDLHPRWNRAGTAVSFDSTHEGNRHLYVTDVSQVFATEN